MTYQRTIIRTEDAQRREPSGHSEPRQDPRGDVDDFIFADQPHQPSER